MLSDMNVPNALNLECPDCGEKTVHEVLRGKISKEGDVLETTVKCQQCAKVYTTVVREPKAVLVPIIVSEMASSKRYEVEMAQGDLVSYEDEMFVEDMPVLITGLEVDGRRVMKAKAEEISTLWAKKFDKVRVRIAVNKGSKTLSVDITATPDEEFFVGDLMTLGREEVVIHSIKTSDGGMAKSGAVRARDIVRIYAKKARTTYS